VTRTLSAPILTGIGQHITEPVYLVEVLLTIPLYWTTADATTWNGHDWQAVGLGIDGISETSARLELRNDNNVGSALVLNNTLRDTEFRIYLFYGSDAAEIFRGYGSDASVKAMEVSIELVANQSVNALEPRMRLAGPTFTRMPKVGDVIKWGGQFYKVTFDGDLS